MRNKGSIGDVIYPLFALAFFIAIIIFTYKVKSNVDKLCLMKSESLAYFLKYQTKNNNNFDFTEDYIYIPDLNKFFMLSKDNVKEVEYKDVKDKIVLVKANISKKMIKEGAEQFPYIFDFENNNFFIIKQNETGNIAEFTYAKNVLDCYVLVK